MAAVVYSQQHSATFGYRAQHRPLFNFVDIRSNTFCSLPPTLTTDTRIDSPLRIRPVHRCIRFRLYPASNSSVHPPTMSSVVVIDVGNASSKIGVARARGVDVIANEVSNRATPSLVSFGQKARALW